MTAPHPTPALVAWSAPRFRAESRAEIERAAPGAAVLADPAGPAHDLAEAFIVAGPPLGPVSARIAREGIFTWHVQPADVAVPAPSLADVVAALSRARRDHAPSRIDLRGLSRADARTALRASRAGGEVAGQEMPPHPPHPPHPPREPHPPRSREPQPPREPMGGAGGAGGAGGPGGSDGPGGPGGSGSDTALSALVAEGWLYLGASPASELPSRWPGGDPRFAPEPVSRAGAKLREALAHLDPLPPGAAVLDLGAAPGGFASVLLERGAHVLAVDPAAFAPALAAAPGLRILRAYADEVDLSLVPPLDLLTCDVVTAPAKAAALVARFAPRLRPGAPAIVTLKLRAKRGGHAQIADAALLFAPHLDVVRIRHLHANRCEVTAFLRRPGSAAPP